MDALEKLREMEREATRRHIHLVNEYRANTDYDAALRNCAPALLEAIKTVSTLVAVDEQCHPTATSALRKDLQRYVIDATGAAIAAALEGK